MNYLQGNAYYATVNHEFLNIKSRNAKNIRSLVQILPSYKVESRIADGDIPSYALTNKKHAEIVVRYFDFADQSQMLLDLEKSRVTSIHWVDKFQMLRAEIALADVDTLAQFSWVKNISLTPPPSSTNNQNASSTHRANILNSTQRGLGYGLTGEGVTIGLWDCDVYQHPDFTDRITNREYEYHSSEHGTHTCGTICGAGIIDPDAKGTAPDATVYAWNFNTQSNGLSDVEERLISLEEDGIEITSNSFGYINDECPNPFSYDNSDENEDGICNQYPYFLFVYSAGNDQTNCTDGYYTTSKNIKNSLIVASQSNEDEISFFSSFGPSYDGRLIPNISGSGDLVYSTSFDDEYTWMGGTSMACPGVAGVMTLVYQRYKETHGGLRPLSSLMRGLACNTATDLGNTGPDYVFGFGAINGRRIVDVMEDNHYLIDSVQQGTSIRQSIQVPADVAELRVMLSWTDVAGTPGTEKALVNDLDLVVTVGANEILPWVLDPSNPSLDAVRGVDQLNNLEQVVIENPVEGEYFIEVSGTTIPSGVQEFAVVYDVVEPMLQLTYPVGGECLEPNSELIFHWDCEGYNQPFNLEYSSNGGINYEIIASDISNDDRYYTYTVPSDTVVSNAKFRISSGSTFYETEQAISIMDVPENVIMSQMQCGGSETLTLLWDSIANAKYEVLKLNDQEFEYFGDAAVNSFEISELVPGETNYYCVRAVDLSSGAISKRSLAVDAHLPMSIVHLPFFDDFDNQSTIDFIFNNTQDYGDVGVSYIVDSQEFGMLFEGPCYWSQAQNDYFEAPNDWVDAVGDSCFLKNPNYIVSASLCNIDASDYSGKKMVLSFDFRQKYYENPGTSYFRVMVNGEYMADSNGNTIFGDTITESYKTLYYDLSNMAGESSFSVVFEAVCKVKYYVGHDDNWFYDYSNDDADTGDFISIDNISIDELNFDYSIESLAIESNYSDENPITITIHNLSCEDGINVPVSYQVNEENEVVELIPDTIPSLSEYVYSFNEKADFSTDGEYTVVAGVDVPNDTLTSNNELVENLIIDATSIRIGAQLDTIINGDVRFTDDGGIYEYYGADIIYTTTFKPELNNKMIAVDFDSLYLEEDFDYLYVYDGPDTSCTLIASFTGSTIPSIITSSASGGELTFQLVSDQNLVYYGWSAHVYCADRTSININLSEIIKPSSEGSIMTDEEEITFEVENLGLQNITKYIAYYQLDSLSPEVEEFTTNLSTNEKEERTFSVKADLSIPGLYNLKVWVEISGDTIEDNNEQTVEIISLSDAPDVGVLEISSIVPAREKQSTITATIENYGHIAISNFDISYRINNGLQMTQTVTDTLLALETLQVDFETKANLTALNESFQIEVYTKLLNDFNTSNDTLITEITTHSDYETNVVANFTGGSNVVRAAGTEGIDLINDYTVECWVNLSDPVRYGHIFNKTNVSLWYQADFGKNYYGTNSYILHVYTEDDELIWYVPNSYQEGVWQHLALTVSTENEYTLYINGEAQQWEVYLGEAGPTLSNIDSPFCIGNRPSDLSRSAIGQIDEVRVWNTCLDETTLRENAMTNYAADTPGLLAYYKFIKGSGKYVYDYSINDNTAVVSDIDVSVLGDDYFWNNPASFISSYTFENETSIIAYDDVNQTYAVIVNNADLSSLVASFENSQNAIVTVTDSVQQSGVTVNNFAEGILQYVVDGTGFNEGIQQTFNVGVSSDLNSYCTLETFSFEMKENPNLLSPIYLLKNGENFEQRVSKNLDVTELKASFTISNGAILIMNDSEQTSPQSIAIDYSKPLLVRVVSENERYFKNYEVFIDAKNDEAELVNFFIVEQQVGVSQIDSINNTVNIWTKNDTDLSTLTAEFEVSENANTYVKTISQRNGVTVNNFDSPVVYSVVSEDAVNTNDWSVCVSKDTIKPVLSFLGNSVITLTKGDSFTDPGALAQDNVDGDISSNITITGSVDSEVVGSYTLNYEVYDAAGNSDTISRTVVVENGTLSDKVLAEDITIYAQDKVVYVEVPEDFIGCSLTIYNVNGSKMQFGSILQSGLNSFTTNLLSGVYLVTIEKDTQLYSDKVMIK